MRTIGFLMLLLISFNSSHAQTEKRYWMAGGDLSFANTNYKPSENKFSYFEISPKVGYFFIDQFAGGLKTQFSSSKTESRNGSSSKLNEFTVGPFARYYFLHGGGQFNFFLEAFFDFGSTKDQTISSTSSKQDVTGYGFSGGPVFFFTTNVGLELSVGFNSSRYSSPSIETFKSNTLIVGVGFQIHLTNSE